MHPSATILVVATSLVLMLTRPRKIAEVWWIGAGTIVLVAARLVTTGGALKAVREGTDVYAFLAGMMLLSELAREHGVFDWLSSRAVAWARGSSVRLFTIVYGIGIVVTTFLSNDATAVVLTPAILAAVRKAKVEPLPHLYVCALVANAASFVLPISNPANLVVFGGAMPSLGHWLVGFLVPSLLSIAVTYGALRFVFRSELRAPLEASPDVVPLSRSGRGVLAGLGLVAAVLLVASGLRIDLGVPTLVSAVLVVAVTSVVTRRSPVKLARSVSWSTLLLVAGLFVMVEAVTQIGAIDLAARGLAWAGKEGTAASLGVAAVVGVANNVVNNLPLGLVAGATVKIAHPPTLLVHALLVGVDLGPNLAVTGSLATLLWLLALRKERIEVGFLDFLRVGLVVMPTALAAALLGLVVMNALTS